MIKALTNLQKSKEWWNINEIWILLQIWQVLIAMYGWFYYSLYHFLAILSHGLAFSATDTMDQQNQHISLNWTFFWIALSMLDPLCFNSSSPCCLKSLSRCSAPWWWSRSTWQHSATTQPSPPATWRLSYSSRYAVFLLKWQTLC